MCKVLKTLEKGTVENNMLQETQLCGNKQHSWFKIFVSNSVEW